MSTFEPHDIVVSSTWCGPSVMRILSADDDGVIFRCSDGHTEFEPTTSEANVGDILGRLRHASEAQIREFVRLETAALVR